MAQNKPHSPNKTQISETTQETNANTSVISRWARELARRIWTRKNNLDEDDEFGRGWALGNSGIWPRNKRGNVLVGKVPENYRPNLWTRKKNLDEDEEFGRGWPQGTSGIWLRNERGNVMRPPRRGRLFGSFRTIVKACV